MNMGIGQTFIEMVFLGSIGLFVIMLVIVGLGLLVGTLSGCEYKQAVVGTRTLCSDSGQCLTENVTRAVCFKEQPAPVRTCISVAFTNGTVFSTVCGDQPRSPVK